MEIDEFTDTYSDDIIYLRDARKTLLTHPLRNEIPSLCNASLCRIYAIVMIGSIEAMLERWLERDNLNILNVYFKKWKDNEERVEKLYSAFTSKGIKVKKDVLDDYLAIKYIRNAIVHASWETNAGRLKQNEIDWIVKRGFPADTRKLDSNHWQRFEWVNENLMMYIALTGVPNSQLRSDLKDIVVPLRSLPDTNGIIDQSDWPKVYWSNLERISSVLDQNIDKALAENNFSRSSNLTNTQLEEMTRHEKMRHLYLSAHTASRQGFDALQDIKEYADNVTMCWNQFVASIKEFRALETAKVKSAIKSLRIMHEKNIHPINHIYPPLRDDAPMEIHEHLVSACFEHIEPLTTREIAEAYELGRKAKYSIMNIMPLRLFSIMLPIYSPKRCTEWHDKAQYIADVFELGQLWYASIEGFTQSNQNIDFYRDMSKAFTDIS